MWAGPALRNRHRCTFSPKGWWRGLHSIRARAMPNGSTNKRTVLWAHGLGLMPAQQHKELVLHRGRTPTHQRAVRAVLLGLCCLGRVREPQRARAARGEGPLQTVPSYLGCFRRKREAQRAAAAMAACRAESRRRSPHVRCQRHRKSPPLRMSRPPPWAAQMRRRRARSRYIYCTCRDTNSRARTHRLPS